LVDVSGPRAIIGGTSSDNYKYCVVVAAGECHTRADGGTSQPGDIFFNHPSLGTPWCTGGGDPNRASDHCLGSLSPMGLAAMQYKTVNDTTGALSYRPLSRMFQKFEQSTLSNNLKLTYGGEWAIMIAYDKLPPKPISRVFEFKVPPIPVDDGINRGT